MSDRRRLTRAHDDWPSLPLEEWRKTLDTVHIWLRIVGKIKLELPPFRNQWWHVAFCRPRGLGSRQAGI